MDFDNLPGGGEEVSVAGYTGVVSRVLRTSYGLEVTVQLNDEDTDTPVRGGHLVHPEAATKYYAAGIPADQRIEEQNPDASENVVPTEEVDEDGLTEKDRADNETLREAAEKRDAKVNEISESSDKADGKVHSHLLDTQARKEASDDKASAPKSAPTAKTPAKATGKN